MTVKEMINILSKFPENSDICLNINGPEDSAWTNKDITIELEDGVVEISGQVWSDDEDSFFPEVI